MAEKKKDGIRFNIDSLEDLGYTFKKPDKSIPSDRVDFSLTHNIEINDGDSQLIIFLNPRYTYGKRDPKLIAEFVFKIVYNVEELEEVIDVDEEGNTSIPDGLLTTLFSISYSTMRGAFFEKSKGTMAERLIIPVVSPIKVLKESKPAEEKLSISN